jgi:hypothetical protein
MQEAAFPDPLWRHEAQVRRRLPARRLEFAGAFAAEIREEE